MFNQERPTPFGFLSQTAEKITAFQQTQHNGNEDTVATYHQSLSKDVQALLSIYSPNPFETVEGCFVGEFLIRFCQPYLDSDVAKQIRSQLSQAREKFPELVTMNNLIQNINRQLFNIDTETATPSAITVKKTKIPEENILISTYMKTLVDRRELLRKIGETTASQMIYAETDTELSLNPTNSNNT